MSTICITCTGGIKNTGKSYKEKPFGYDKGLFLVPLNADDGTRNFLDLNASDMDAELLGKLNNTDPSKRWYLLGDLQDVTSITGDAAFESSATDERSNVREGVKNYDMMIWDATHKYYKQLRGGPCVDFGIVRLDECGNMLGETNADQSEFYPREVRRASYNDKYVDRLPGATSKIHINFDFARSTNDAFQVMLSADSFPDLNPYLVRSMLDVKFDITVDSATELTVKASFLFGSLNQEIPALGLETQDTNFDIVASVTGISVGSPSGIATTGTDGTYTFTIPAVTSATVYDFDYFKAATAERENGFEGVPVTFIAQ